MADELLHCTPEHVAEYEGLNLAQPAGTIRIRKASRVIDKMLTAAVYDTDQDGRATDPRVLATLAEACAAQVKWFADTGDTSGAQAQVSGGSIGKVSLPTVKSDGSGRSKRASRDSPEAFDILHSAAHIRWSVGH